jgi:hypothetical protein
MKSPPLAPLTRSGVDLCGLFFQMQAVAQKSLMDSAVNHLSMAMKKSPLVAK